MGSTKPETRDPLRAETLTTDELRLRADLAEQELRQALQRLEGSVRSQVAPGRLMDEYGDILMLGAFGLGLLIGLRRR